MDSLIPGSIIESLSVFLSLSLSLYMTVSIFLSESMSELELSGKETKI